MKLYGISGLGADKRVFKSLTLDCEIIPLEWITPMRNESLESYSSRLSRLINTDEEFGIIGVSFGGLVATEISKLLNPKITILISSAETCKELRFVYRLAGKLKLIQFIPSALFNLPRTLALWVFGTKNKLLIDILDDTDLNFAKWAIQELISWENENTVLNPILKISGEKDKLIPPNVDENTTVIPDGQHFMIIDKAKEISEIINYSIRKTNRQQRI